MPTKKPKKAAKKPGKATPGKVSQTVAAPKKANRPQLTHTPMSAISKVPVKPNKPVPKSSAAKTAPAKATRAKSAPIDDDSDDVETSEKLAPMKFDTRPLVLPTRPVQNDDDGEVDPSSNASLLAGP